MESKSARPSSALQECVGGLSSAYGVTRKETWVEVVEQPKFPFITLAVVNFRTNLQKECIYKKYKYNTLLKMSYTSRYLKGFLYF